MLMDGEDNINLPAEMRFLLNAQMAEADLIVLNKIDTAGADYIGKCLELIRALHPDTPVMAMSAKTGEGVDAVADYIISHAAAAEHREIGYGSEAFMAAERLMSWYNRRVFFEQREGKNLDFNAALACHIRGRARLAPGQGRQRAPPQGLRLRRGRGLFQGQPCGRGLPHRVRPQI